MSNANYDVIVIGAGHAGCEAAHACAVLGLKTLLLTGNTDRIGYMSCNPAIGGLGKGHLVREIDALGGLMGKTADATGIQYRRLNTRKGPAVQGTRCQSDMYYYARHMKNLLEGLPHLTIRQAIVDDILLEDQKISGIRTSIGEEISARAVVLTTGTFMSGLCHIGLTQIPGGRIPDFTAHAISDSLKKMGLELGRLKTGTVPRLDGRTIHFDALEPQWGDDPRPRFSYEAVENPLRQVACHITHTNSHTHEIIRSSLDQSPLFTGVIKGVGPRYCPSIEDKIHRFAGKDHHQIFLEPVSLESHEIYPNGLSTSLPLEVQLRFLRTIPGLEEVEIMKPGYAVEYDYVLPHQISHSLETKTIANFFCAGQINGTTGYEEAAAQGLMAGINAALKLMGREPLILGRSQAYIGVLIDDLVTKGVGGEPYRMFTSRAEHRISLREDNADFRLSALGRQIGLLPPVRMERTHSKKQDVDKLIAQLDNSRLNISAEVSEKLEAQGLQPLLTSITASDFLARPHAELKHLFLVAPDLFQSVSSLYSQDVCASALADLKYRGYLKKVKVDFLEQDYLAKIRIPLRLEYQNIGGLSNEVKEKLTKVRPVNLDQASRIPGITPSALSILAIHLRSAISSLS